MSIINNILFQSRSDPQEWVSIQERCSCTSCHMAVCWTCRYTTFRDSRILVLSRLMSPDKLLYMVPHRCCFTSSQLCIDWYQSREATQILLCSQSQYNCCWNASAYCHFPTYSKAALRACGHTRIFWSLPCCKRSLLDTFLAKLSAKVAICTGSVMEATATLAVAKVTVAETIRTINVPMNLLCLTWGRAHSKVARTEEHCQLHVKLTGRSASDCLLNTMTLVVFKWDIL